MQLVERVRPDADGERERDDDRAEPAPGDRRREASADHDVREVPGGVREVEERDVVTPASRRERVEGRPHASGRLRPALRAHDLAPHITTPPPRLRRRTSTSCRPASRHHSSWRSSGYRGPEGTDRAAEEAADLAPAAREHAAGEREARRRRRAPRAAGRGRPGRRTRARRRGRPGARRAPARASVAPGSST